MAPRRGNHHHGQNGGFMDMGFNLGLDLDHPYGESIIKCSCPSGCLREDVGGLMGPAIRIEDMQNVIRVLCSNEHCKAGEFMHRECFESWEQSVLNYLKSCGRARSWSERQRLQNLWTKKGYDLAFKACGCKCGRGHLKKDLVWNEQRKIDDPADSKKKKKNRNRNQKVPMQGVNGNVELPRIRTGSLSSSTGSVSPPVVQEAGTSPSNSVTSVGWKKKPVKIDNFNDRLRNACAGNGIFSRRQDFSAFNNIPKTRLNSFNVKMEDEDSHGNDETRVFILSTLAGRNMSRMCCVLCNTSLEIYDRYPLVDGTFFLSPRQYSKNCIEVKEETKTRFLAVVCLSCLSGRFTGKRLTCLYCSAQWTGTSFQMGTMYSFDIIAALPCCSERLRCNNCRMPLLPPQKWLNDFSGYSKSLACPHCQAVDTHFVRPLSLCFTKDILSLFA